MLSRVFAFASVLALICHLPACSSDDSSGGSAAAAGAGGSAGAGAGGSAGSGPSSVKQTVGPDGGVITVGGATVTFPAGALAAATEITITATDEAAPDGFVALSKVFKCEPSPLDFPMPVTMAMPFSPDGQPATVFWSSGADPAFKDVGGTATGAIMTAGVKHFSRGFVGRAK